MTDVFVVNNKQDSQQSEHKAGNFYVGTDGIYVLASVDSEHMSLIGVHGNRWHKSISVKNHKKVTSEEFSLLTYEETFVLLNSVTITLN